VNHGNLRKKSQLAKKYNYDEKVEVKKNAKWSISASRLRNQKVKQMHGNEYNITASILLPT